MKKSIWLVVLLAILVVAVGCTNETSESDKAQRKATEKAASEAQSQIGMPAIVNFQERKLAKMIFELRDQENLRCYAYLENKMTGRLVFVGECIGYGLPYSVQFTNPSKPLKENTVYHDSTVIPQADPNQLFMPSGLSATWLMMIDPKTGDARPCYFEPTITVTPFRLPNAVYPN